MTQLWCSGGLRFRGDTPSSEDYAIHAATLDRAERIDGVTFDYSTLTAMTEHCGATMVPGNYLCFWVYEEGEEWRPVVGFEGAYEVSDLGRVRSLDRVRTAKQRVRSGRLATITQRLRGKVLRPGIASNGYPTVALNSETRTVHSLVADAFIGPRPDNHQIRHLNGNRLDPTKNNLCYGTVTENALDVARHGRRSLSPRTVTEIRHAIRRGETLADIGRRYGIFYQQVGYIRDSKQYAHVG